VISSWREVSNANSTQLCVDVCAHCSGSGPTEQLSDEAFNPAMQQLGEKRIVDLMALVGFYQTVSLMMNVDRYPLNNNQKPELQPLARPLPLSPRTTTANNTNGERFIPLRSVDMTPRQKALADMIQSGKIEGGLDGPVNVLLRSPELGEAILRYGAYARFHTPLALKLTELAAMLTIRNWTSQYLWYVHRRAAVQAGWNEQVIKSIAEGKRPQGLKAEEEAIYNFCDELLRTTQMTDATFNGVREQVGERGVVEIMGIIGYYQTAAMLLNTDRYPLPAGTTPELK
jgi:4-carboxymuconolactone decarboxylase